MLTFFVFTDFSAAATNALHYAIVLARPIMAHIQLLHVRPPVTAAAADCFNSLCLEQAKQVQENLNHLVAGVQQFVSCAGGVLAGIPDQEIPALLQSVPNGIVVLGNSNPAKAMRTAWTSTGLYLIRTVTLPLLVVPVTYRACHLPQRIVFDMDRKPVELPASAAIVPELLSSFSASQLPLRLDGNLGAVDDLLQRTIPQVVGIHVYTSETAPEAGDIASRIQQTGLLAGMAHTVATSRYPAIEEGIRHSAARHRADLLGFIARQRMYPGRQFLQSVTAGLIAHSRIPVLAVPER
ncbi:universal stress protein [Hymenobacter canadensis]|uniref:Universal stress protein n=1 Tax=Hymenobacter canadensis TaxID=2999067 RepID=A0ABY7LPF5_9BACT|nr:universal stress protein [Hymenobacter canadensis]WBA42302.1 universal stress protein [Hymenobacter canadensis]